MLDLVMVNAYIAYMFCKVQTPSLTNGPRSPRPVENAKSYIGKKTFVPSNDVPCGGDDRFP